MSTTNATYQYQSKAFSPESLKAYTIRILVREHVLTYVVLNGTGKVVAIRQYHGSGQLEPGALFNQVHKEDYFLKESYGKTEVVSGSLSFSLIPNQFFVSNRVKEFAGALIKEGNNPDHLEYLQMDRTGTTAIFTIPSELKDLCDTELEDPVYIPSCQPLINMGRSMANPSKDLLVVTLFSNQFVITGMKQGKLALCNTYDYRSPADLVYFTQVVADIVDLGENGEILIQGDLESDGVLLGQLQELIPRLKVPTQELKERFLQDGATVPYHKYAFLSF